MRFIFIGGIMSEVKEKFTAKQSLNKKDMDIKDKTQAKNLKDQTKHSTRAINKQTGGASRGGRATK